MDTLAGASRKIQLRLIWPLVLLMFLSSLDRVNVSFGALQMNRAIGLTPSTYGLGVGLFFVGYIAFQIPSTLLLRRFGARKWLFGVVVSWGLLASAMSLVTDATSFYALRVALGFAESGFAPGIVFLCSQWLPARHRGVAVAATMLAIPISIILGAPLSGWLMGMTNPLGWPGWRWMFLIEGLPTVALAVACWFWFVDTPALAKWLTAQEKSELSAALDAEAVGETGAASWLQLVLEPRVWISAAAWFAMLAGAYGIIFWLPQVVRQMAGGDPLQVGLITALPWVAVGSGMMLNAWHSDRTQERFWHIAAAALLGSAGLIAAGSVSGTGLALVFLIVGGFGLGSCQGVFWTTPPSFLPRATLGAGITVINMVGNASGVVTPWAIGAIREATGAFKAPIYAMAGLLALAALLILLLRAMSPRARRAPAAG